MFLNKRALNNGVKDQSYDWAKEVVVVTGGSDGIGKAAVLFLAEKNIKVAVLDVQPLSYAPPPTVSHYTCDIRSPSAIAEAAAAIRVNVGEPTVLVNNAGVCRGKTILDSTEWDLRLTFDVNTLSHYFLAQEFLPSMVKANHGMVVTVASSAGYVTAASMVDYAASKAAAIAFHEGLASELVTRYNAPKVRTVLIAQGYTRTSLFQGWAQKPDFLSPVLEPETVAEAIVKKVLQGESGEAILPGWYSLVVPWLRAMPDWASITLRNDCQSYMVGWHGRQVINPEEKSKRPA